MTSRRILQALGVERRSIQNPAVPLTSSKVLEYLGAGATSEAGPVVTAQGALAYLVVLSCTKVLADAVAAMPARFFRRIDDRRRDFAPDHPADALIRREPNPEMGPATFKETLQAHLCTWGNGYARILHDGGGNPRSLWPLLPHETEPKRRTDTWDLVYPSKWHGRDVTLDPLEVLHVPALGFDGLKGYSPVGMARQSIGLGMAAEQFAARFYRNGAWLAGVFEHPLVLSANAHGNLKKALEEKHTGAVNAWRPLILEEGMKWHQAAMPAEDAMFLSLRKLEDRRICGLYRVPPHLVADLENGASYSSVEQLGLSFVMFSLAPWLVKWEQELTRKLGGDPEVFAEFNVASLLKADTVARFNAYRTGRDGGWLSVNDVRALENLPPVDGGDEYLRPLNMGRLGEPPPPTTPPAAPAPGGSAAPQPPQQGQPKGAALEAVRALVIQAGGRLVQLEVDRVRRAAKGAGGPAAAAVFYGQHQEHLEEAMRPVGLALAAVLAGTAVPNGEDLKALAAGAAKDAAAWYCAQARAALEAAGRTADGKLEDALKAWPEERPPQLAAQLEGNIQKRLDGRTAA